MVGVRQFAATVVPRGVTSVIADPHEITNVLGLDGIRYMFDQAKYGQLSMFVMVPSCVPATHMATAGAYLEAKDITSLQNDRWVLGLAEMMNYPGVVREDPLVLEKLDAFKTRVLDGHAPGLSGKDLNAYLTAGIGSDHECTNTEEALEKLRLGMYILIREATNAHNLGKLLPMITPDNARRICFCTDDRHPADLLDEGSVDHLVRSAIRAGIDLVTAIRMATLNPAEWFRLYDRGGIRPGNRADLIVFDDPQEFAVRLVIRSGQVVAEDGKMLPFELPERPSYLRGSINVNWHTVDFTIPAEGRRAHVIGADPDDLITEDRVLEILHGVRLCHARHRPRHHQDGGDRAAHGHRARRQRLRAGARTATRGDRLHDRARSPQPDRGRHRQHLAQHRGRRRRRHGRRAGRRRRRAHPGAPAAARGRADVQQADRRGAPRPGRRDRRRAQRSAPSCTTPSWRSASWRSRSSRT